MSDARLAGLRLVFITPGRLTAEQTSGVCEAALEGGVTALLLREPQLPTPERGALYRRLTRRCHTAGALALVSRDVELAHDCGADGVHTGWGGPSVAEVRRDAAGLLCGLSAHWPLPEQSAAADYISLSPFRATPDSHPRPLLTREQIEAVLGREDLGPVLALGGLEAGDVPDLPTGLAGVAVLRALADARDPRAAAAVLRSLADVLVEFGGTREVGRGSASRSPQSSEEAGHGR